MIKWFKKYKNLSDVELVDLYRNKSDMNALGVLFERYSHLIATIAINILKAKDKASDASQEIFEIVAKDLKNHEVKNFNNWLYSVVRFHCLKCKKSANKNIEAPHEVVDEQDDLTNLELEIQYSRRMDTMTKGLNEIKENQKICIELFYIKGCSYQQVVDKTGFSMKEVKSFIQNGKRNLKEFIIKNNG